ncbi:MAG TPA: helix-turn-helix transcriptional regulator [Polyangiaceae bacterium]|nr:helix-turn-helix transcriptional regulator [Polyangiaceae bacterium]
MVEAAYAIHLDQDAWLAGLVQAAEPGLAEELGLVGYVYDARRLPLEIESIHVRGSGRLVDYARRTVAMASTNADFVDATWRAQSVATVSQTVDMRTVESASDFVANGINDFLIVNAYDVSATGVWIGAALPTLRRPTARESLIWSRVAAHIAAGYRLRRRREGRPAAVLSPSGKLEHPEGEATEGAARAALRQSVLRMEAARGRLREQHVEQAIEGWQPLTDARWSLIDQFESDGRRYVVAVENALAPKAPDGLALREQQVVAAAASGRTTKLIAYELGLNASTVRVLLSRAARKLDLRSRAELVALYRAYARKVTL